MIKKITGIAVCVAALLFGTSVAYAKGEAEYQLAGVLNAAVESCGLYNDSKDYWDYYDGGGVAYAEAIDFNGDGVRELFYIYGIPGAKSYKKTIYQYRYAVWAYENGSVRQLVNAPIAASDSIASMIRLSICPQDFGSTYLETFDESEWLAATYTYSTYMDGAWKEMAKLRKSWYEKKFQTYYYYTFNGESISEGYFWQLDTHYRKNARDISPADFSGKKVQQQIEFLRTAKDQVEILVNEKPLLSQNPPMLHNGVTMIPIRAVGEAMGYEVIWDGETGSVILVGEGVTAVFDGTELLVNDTAYPVETLMLHDTTYVPVRVVERFGAQVLWTGADQPVRITY